MGTVSMRGIAKAYGAAKVIHGVDLEVTDGEFMVFVGPSGCGKSTMLRMIAGLESIDEGELKIAGSRVNEIAPVNRGVAMVFQSYALYPHMTVAENMGFSLRVAGVAKKDREEQVGRAAEILHITELLDRKPKALSGGQRQRVAIGRCIVRKPKVFLFDEPLSNLDAALRVQMRMELVRLHQELGITMIYVTHDQVEAMTMGNRIAVFNEGVIEQVGPPMELYEKPSNRFVAGFLGTPEMNFLPCEVVENNGGKPSVRVAGSYTMTLPGGLSAGISSDIDQLGIRPERMRIVSAEEGLPVKIAMLEKLGDVTIAHAELMSGRTDIAASLLAIKLAAGQDDGSIRQGEIIGLKPEAEHTHFFSKEGAVIFG